MTKVRFWFGLRPRQIALLVAIGATQATTIAAFVLVMRRVFDEIGTGRGVSGLLTTILQLGAASLIVAITRGLEFSVSESFGYDKVQELRLMLYRHLTGMSPRSIQRSSRGALILRFTGDLSTVRTWVARGLSRGIISSFTVVGVLLLLFALNVRMGIAVMGVLLLGTALSLMPGQAVRRAMRAVRWRRSLLTSNIAEQVNALAVVQVFGRVAGEASRLTRQSNDLTTADKHFVRVRGHLRFIASAMSSAAVVAIVVVGAQEVAKGRTTVGVVASAITAMRFASGPLRTLGRSHEYWQAAQVSKRKLGDFLNRPSQPQDAPTELERLKVRRGEIVFRGVSAAGVLHEIDMTISGGQVLAVMGANGAGKTTLLNVIARFVEPDVGDVLIDDQRLTDCSTRSIYRHLGVVSADLPLMRGTIRRNILYRYPDASPEEVERVVLSCRLDEMVPDRVDGLTFWLTEGGANLPAGHRQRVALARALVGNPRILLLDEPTANLDEATKEVFRRAIARYSGTVLLVTHDPAEASLADHVCTMADGRIVEHITGDEYRERVRTARRANAGRPTW